MDEPFLPYLLAFVLPLGWLLTRTAPLSSPVVRWSVRGFLLALVLLRFPFGGADPVFVRRIDLLLATTLVALSAAKAVGAEWTRERPRYRAMLLLASLAAVTTYTNFFSFHHGSWMHLHDVAHYYLGSKYAREIDYGELYTAILRAEAEEYGNLTTREARDPRGSYLVPIERLLERSDAVKQRFSPPRWLMFRADVRMFREAMGAAWPEVVKDHGYNPTPVWSVIGGALANRVPAGNLGGVFLLTLIDPLLLAIAFAALTRAFDLETALVVASYYCLCFGGEFAWKGGAFLRELSFSALVLAAACAAGSRHAAAGAFLGLAASLRIYPLLFAAGPTFRLLGSIHSGRVVSRPHLRFVAGFAAAGTILFVMTAAGPGGIARWNGFAANITGHAESASANVIGLTTWFAYLRSASSPPWGLSATSYSDRWLYGLQLATLFLPALGYVARRSQSEDDMVGSIALGCVLVLAGLNVSGYYYTFLVFLLLARRDRPADLALIFAAELAVYAIALFEAHDVMLYLYKSLLLFWLFLALYVPKRLVIADGST